MAYLISTLLITAWMFSVVLGVTLGGAIHALALGGVMTILLGGNRRLTRP